MYHVSAKKINPQKIIVETGGQTGTAWFTFPAMPLYTVSQVSALVGFHLKSVYRAISDGRLEAVRVGTRTLRVSDSALTAWVSKGKKITKAVKEKRK